MTQSGYNNLTELLLNVIRPRPGMYLGTNHISKLPNLILGYEFSDRISKQTPDFYFGGNGFLTWYVDTYKPPQMSYWHDYFLSETADDEVKALDLYFIRLDEYYDWYKTNHLK